MASSPRNHRVITASSQTWDEIEAKLLNGQKLQGTITAKDVMVCLQSKQAASA